MIELQNDSEAIIKWFKVICKAYGVCFAWNEM